jgi:hypothetical protein
MVKASANRCEAAMKTMFKLLCESCGFSLPEAAGYVGASLDTAKSWSSGRTRGP